MVLQAEGPSVKVWVVGPWFPHPRRAVHTASNTKDTFTIRVKQTHSHHVYVLCKTWMLSVRRLNAFCVSRLVPVHSFFLIYCMLHYTRDGQRNSELVPFLHCVGPRTCTQPPGLAAPTHLHLASPSYSILKRLRSLAPGVDLDSHKPRELLAHALEPVG